MGHRPELASEGSSLKGAKKVTLHTTANCHADAKPGGS